MGELYALSPFRPILLCNWSRGVGDFQVATGGGFWVAVRVFQAFLKISIGIERFKNSRFLSSWTLNFK